MEYRYNDLPCEGEDDDLDTFKYVKSLAQFIKDCTPPMNISIQGEWGAGKTTILNQLIEILDKEECEINKNEKKFIQVYFDTSVYSELSKGRAISYYFVSYILNNLDIKKQSSEKLKKYFKLFIDCASSKVMGDPNKIRDILNENLDIEYEVFRDLKKEYNEQINQVLGDERKLIVYIDDLDRLQPEKAVEFIESLKLFFDSEKVINVVAIDFDIIKKGLSQKYGIDELNKKSGDFFEKYFQLSFRMPIEKYNIKKFLGGFLNKNNKELIEFISDINLKNPRKIKKILNSIKLLKFIEPKNIIYSEICLVIEQVDFETYITLLDCEDEDDLFNLINNETKEINPYIRRALKDFLERKEKKIGNRTSYDYLIQALSKSTLVTRAGTQNHKINKDVQILMRKIINYLCGEERFDLDGNLGKESQELREGTIKDELRNALKGFKYFRLTSGKGQGIVLTKNRDDKQGIYFSGDYGGKLFNDGLIIFGKKLRNTGLEDYKVEILNEDEKQFHAFISQLFEYIKIYLEEKENEI